MLQSSNPFNEASWRKLASIFPCFFPTSNCFDSFVRNLLLPIEKKKKKPFCGCQSLISPLTQPFSQTKSNIDICILGEKRLSTEGKQPGALPSTKPQALRSVQIELWAWCEGNPEDPGGLWSHPRALVSKLGYPHGSVWCLLQLSLAAWLKFFLVLRNGSPMSSSLDVSTELHCF